MSFEARYSGWCEACDEPIHPGQMIAFAEGNSVVARTGRFVHTICPDPLPAVTRQVCGRCFMEPAVSGECGCDE